MSKQQFDTRLKALFREQEKLIRRKNVPVKGGNGIYTRYKYPIVTAEHAAIHWRYDLDYKTNPFLMERIGVNCTFNSGAIELDGKILLIVRVEGNDRKSFFAVAESKNGVDNFRFWDYPVTMPEVSGNPDTNVYDTRLVKHEDGWIYGLFCTERKDPEAPASDTSSAVAECGIARTKDLKTWETASRFKNELSSAKKCRASS